MVTDTVIDLGERWLADAELDSFPAPAGPTGRTTRPWLAAVAVLATVALIAVASRPLATLDLIGSLPARAFDIGADGENFYVLRAGGPFTLSMSAYAWRDGTTRWERPLVGGRTGLYLAAGRVFLVDRACDGDDGSVERIDEATGRQRWLGSGVPVGLLAGPGPASPPRLLVSELRGLPCAPTRIMRYTPYQLTLSAVDADTGAPQWTVQMRPGQRLAAPDRPGANWFALWDTAGTLEIHDAATGAITSSANVVAVPGATWPQAARVAGDLLLVVTQQVSGTTLSAYRRDGLALAWRQTIASLEPVGCGPMICVPTPTSVTVLDRTTGYPAWRRDVLVDAVTDPAARFDATAGTNLVLARDRGKIPHARAIDWRTGREVLDLPGWQPVPSAAADPTTVLLAHTDSDPIGIGALDLRTGELRLLGKVPSVPGPCALAVRRLGCVNAAGTAINLWRVPTRPSG